MNHINREAADALFERHEGGYNLFILAIINGDLKAMKKQLDACYKILGSEGLASLLTATGDDGKTPHVHIKEFSCINDQRLGRKDSLFLFTYDPMHVQTVNYITQNTMRDLVRKCLAKRNNSFLGDLKSQCAKTVASLVAFVKGV